MSKQFYHGSRLIKNSYSILTEEENKKIKEIRERTGKMFSPVLRVAALKFIKENTI